MNIIIATIGMSILMQNGSMLAWGSDAIAYPPKLLFTPTLEGFVNLFTVQTHQTHDFIAHLPPPTSWYERLARSHDMVIAGPSRVIERFLHRHAAAQMR